MYCIQITRGERQEVLLLRAQDEVAASAEISRLLEKETTACTITLHLLSTPLSVWMRQSNGAVFQGDLKTAQTPVETLPVVRAVTKPAERETAPAQTVPADSTQANLCFCSNKPLHLSYPERENVTIVSSKDNDEYGFDYIVRCSCGREALVSSYEVSVGRTLYYWGDFHF